jgi:hypothetical protein
VTNKTNKLPSFLPSFLKEIDRYVILSSLNFQGRHFSIEFFFSWVYFTILEAWNMTNYIIFQNVEIIKKIIIFSNNPKLWKELLNLKKKPNNSKGKGQKGITTKTHQQ